MTLLHNFLEQLCGLHLHNAEPDARREVGARNERTLYAVAWMSLLGASFFISRIGIIAVR
jgi:hypothetical protein